MSDGENKKAKNIKRFLWISDKKNYLFLALAIVVLGTVVIQKSSFFSSKKSKDEIITANECYKVLKETSFCDEQKLSELKNIMQKYPFLKTKYDGIVLQNLILNERVSDEEYQLAENLIQRTRDELPYYNDFSKTALLISKGKFDEALKDSIELKEKILKDESFFKNNKFQSGFTLFSLNLFRIACLERKLNHPENELAAWNELEKYTCDFKNIDQNTEISNDLNEIFREKEIELIDYIKYRKNQISSIKS
ncbi:MAG: hypothetical protein WCT85_06410 [Parachlamydiales bacterium]|jgi:hypothetical protein